MLGVFYFVVESLLRVFSRRTGIDLCWNMYQNNASKRQARGAKLTKQEAKPLSDAANFKLRLPCIFFSLLIAIMLSLDLEK